MRVRPRRPIARNASGSAASSRCQDSANRRGSSGGTTSPDSATIRAASPTSVTTHGTPPGQSFCHDVRKALAARYRAGHVERRRNSLHVRPATQPQEPGAESSSTHEVVDATARFSPVPGKQEPDVRTTSREEDGRPQERVVVLHRVDPGNEADQRNVHRNAQLPADTRACSGIGPEAFGIDPVGNEEPRAGPVSEPAVRVVAGPRVDHDPVRPARSQPAGVERQAREDSVPVHAHVGAPHVPDDATHPSEPSDDQTKQVGVVEPRLEHVRPQPTEHCRQAHYRRCRRPTAPQAERHHLHPAGPNAGRDRTRLDETDHRRGEPVAIHPLDQPRQHQLCPPDVEAGDEMTDTHRMAVGPNHCTYHSGRS